jgi:murein DD-endopeptidase MepM/ murein hydrolase activator NlpD
MHLLLVLLALVLPPAAAPARFGWPVSPARVVRAFDPPPRPWLAGHRGADLAASPGVVVRAAGAGTVIYAGMIAGRGVVSVAHPDGLRTTYEPLTPAVRAGAVVPEGAPLGTLTAGHPGCPAAACLHWGLLRGAVYLDPLALLGLGRVRLLPLTA